MLCNRGRAMAGEVTGTKRKRNMDREEMLILTRAAGRTLWALVVDRAGCSCGEDGGRAHKQGSAEWKGA